MSNARKISTAGEAVGIAAVGVELNGCVMKTAPGIPSDSVAVKRRMRWPRRVFAPIASQRRVEMFNSYCGIARRGLTTSLRRRTLKSLLRKTRVMKTAQELQQRILALIARGAVASVREGGRFADLGGCEQQFNELALEIFEFQFARNKIYRGWCEARRQTPASATHWKQIPAVPTIAFKDFEIVCFDVKEAVAEFHTSGTTRGKSGRHFFKTLELYDAAIAPNFETHVLAGSLGLLQRRAERRSQNISDPCFEPPLRLGASVPFILTASPEEAPHSSLSHMMGVLGGQFFVRGGKLAAESLAAALEVSVREAKPVLLLGTAWSFVHFFEHCEGGRWRFALPEGSRAMETGGFKGKSREMLKRQLYELFEKYLGIAPSRVVNEYGMTELSTQFYDETLLVGRQSDRKTVPPWARVMIVDPRTGKEAEDGQRGLIRIFDLANLWSAMAIQTEDWGVKRGEGFEVLGRAAASEARGCSIAADEMLSL
jgi:hypothetical protein